ncbi:MAG: TIGR03013 family PEP-CTERM/XrtA system glycosyltransferase [Rhodobacteraceae bacterium]|nr:TIGR03013 family PEP-CTERM/XrtA system glycosyltransferase [Paracoccaceae bacterium]
MVRIFGHYISLRAILFAVFELAAFIALYNIFKIITLYVATRSFVPLPGQWLLTPTFCAIAFLTSSACGMYNKDTFSDIQELFARLLTVSVLMYFMMAVVISLSEILAWPQANLKLYYAITLGACAGYCAVALLFRLNILSTNFNGTVLERRVLVLGVDERAAKIANLDGHSRSPYHAVGFLPVGTEAKDPHLDDALIIKNGALEKPGGLQAVASEHNVDEIVVASRERRGLDLDALLTCKLSGVAVTDFPTFWERQTGQIDLYEVAPSWLIFSNGFKVNFQRDFTKRCFDIFVSTALLLITLPITLVTAILVKFDSPGPIFYRQIRVGLDGKPYSIFKFRSMRSDAERDGVARWAQTNDSRVTKVGAFIRKTRIDEIPQVINILMGEMSFVGPRPERPEFVEELKKKIPYYDVRHHVKPGLTGWAQINYPYGASDEDAKAKLAFDLYYVKNWNLFLDAVILFQTARVVIWREGAR